MARITFENEGLPEMFDDLSRKIPEKVPDVLNTMADTLKQKLVQAAPYDGSQRHKDKHLKQVISKTAVRSSTKNGTAEKYITIFVSPRGIRGAVQGKKARENWNKDKHVFKLVVSEFGSSKQPAKPWWKPTVEKAEDSLTEICSDALLSEVDKIADT